MIKQKAAVTQVLTINGGSSSIKFALFDAENLRRGLEGKSNESDRRNPPLRSRVHRIFRDVCRESAAKIPAEVIKRLSTADKLSDEDCETMTDIARQALTAFHPKPKAPDGKKP